MSVASRRWTRWTSESGLNRSGHLSEAWRLLSSRGLLDLLREETHHRSQGALDLGNDVEDVLFGCASIHGSGAASLGRHDKKSGLACVFCEFAPIAVKHAVFVAAHTVKRNDERSGLAAVVTSGDEHPIRLEGLVNRGLVGFVEITGSGGERLATGQDHIGNPLGVAEFVLEVVPAWARLSFVHEIVKGQRVFGARKSGTGALADLCERVLEALHVGGERFDVDWQHLGEHGKDRRSSFSDGEVHFDRGVAL